MELEFAPLELTLARPWTIARGTSTKKRNGLLTLGAEGVTGFGEAAPNARYGQSFEGALAAFDRVREAVAALSPWEHRAWIERAEEVCGLETEVTAAVDLALWDWKGKRLGASVSRLLGVEAARMPATSFSLSIGEPAALAAQARKAAPYSILKLKLGGAADEESVRAVRAVTDKPLRLDANEGWASKEAALETIVRLAPLGIELLEQPLPSGDVESMRWLAARSPIPLVADESALRARDLPPLAGAFRMVNVKLAKCGGLTRALEMAAAARALGFGVMLGCMIESSLGIAAAAAIAPIFDAVDLDGNLLLARDPFAGLSLREGRWILPVEPGLGVALNAAATRGGPSSRSKRRGARGSPRR